MIPSPSCILILPQTHWVVPQGAPHMCAAVLAEPTEKPCALLCPDPIQSNETLSQRCWSFVLWEGMGILPGNQGLATHIGRVKGSLFN